MFGSFDGAWLSTRRVMSGLLGALTVALSLLVAACGGSDSGPGAGKRFLSMGSAPPGGAFYVVAGAVSEVLTSSSEGRWEVTNEATKGSRENIRRLDRGELDLALANSAVTYFASLGGEGWEKAFAARTVATMAPNIALFLAKKSSGIERIADLRGRRVVIGPAGAGFEDFVRPLVEAHGVDWSTIDVVNNTQSGAVDMLADGQVAAAFLGGAIPTASITQAGSTMEVTYIPYDQEAVAALVAKYPFYAYATIPAGSYPGLDVDFPALDVGSMHLITGLAAPEELIYQLTKALWEHRAEIAERHPAGRSLREGNVVRDTGTPFHPGAIRYYQESGLWPRAAQ